MKVALISTVYNEAGSIGRWIDAVKAQTIRPDEFVITDGGSTDATVRLLEEGFVSGGFPKPRIIVQRCNIARGRNLAIRNTTADLIASVDASAIPEPRWLEEITRPFREHPGVDVVGGFCPLVVENVFQKRVEKYNREEQLPVGSDCSSSSRNIAFTRKAWESVGGYPEWVTLTAEDALFNANLHFAGVRFYYQPSARVSWELRPDLPSYLKMVWNYGYGSAEIGQFPRIYCGWLLTTLAPPLILFSRHPLSDALLRYRRNAAGARGWVEGKLKGHRPPGDWRRIDGIWISPQALATVRGKAP
jgi:cellulose synthase/poly-beta-1,6-N-acetylglucosamine synthase-like glycosyltransferase